MKLERLPELVTSATALAVGLLLAYVAGRLTGDGEMKLVMGMGILIGIGALILGMRTKIWLLLPLCWELTGRIPLIDIPVSIRDYSVVVVGCSFLIFYALKLIRFKQPFEALDFIIFTNLIYLATVYLRNPVGSSWLGSELVGGRPYFDIGVAFVAFWILSRAPVDVKTARRMPIMMLVGSALVSLGTLLVTLVPGTSKYLGLVYSSFAPPDPMKMALMTEDQMGRKQDLVAVGHNGMRVFCAYFNPATFLSPLYPLRFLGTVAFVLCILFSGFRSAILTVVVYVCISAYFRRKMRDIVIFAIIGAMGIAVLAIGNGRIFDLPMSVQRSLSFLPGNWDYAAVRDAQNSTEWRWQIWKMVLTEDKWIQNKLLGDGFGFTKHELSIMQSVSGFGGDNQEAFLIVGNYHSGPISTIRYVGVVGLLLYLPFMIMLLVKSVQLIRASQGTPLFPVALFIGMPVIFNPIPFVFVAGGFDTNFIELLFAAGMLRMVSRALETLPGSSVQLPPPEIDGRQRPPVLKRRRLQPATAPSSR